MTLSADTLRVPAAAMQAAHQQADPAFLAAVRRIRDNILEFQRAILHHDVRLERPDGVYLQQRYVPLRRVGICVPGGAAAYPSTVLMTAVPAQAAGVEQLAIVAPPTPFGADNPDVLATCSRTGRRPRCIGWAEPKAWRPWPTVSNRCRPWTRSWGPGICSSRWPSAMCTARSISTRSPVRAKSWSIADESTNPRFTAADLLAQAEHSPGAVDPDYLVPGNAHGHATRTGSTRWATCRAAI